MFFIAPFRTSKHVMLRQIRTSSSPSSTMQCVRSEQNVALRARPTKPDARGARYQHPGFGAAGSTGAPGGDLSRLAGGTLYALDLRRAARRVEGDAAPAHDCR